MNANDVNLPINPPYQTGAVLVVALILLIVLTMLGISGIEATKLETRMANNVSQYNLAFQDAEGRLANLFNQCVSQATKGGACDDLPGVTSLGSECASAGSSGSSLNRNYSLATVTGTSNSSDPNAIQVTLVAGMWSPGPQDNMLLKTTNQAASCNNEEEEACSLLSQVSDCTNYDTDAGPCAQTIANLLENNPTSGCSEEELINKTCENSPAPQDCYTAILGNSLVSGPSLPASCMNDPPNAPPSAACQGETRDMLGDPCPTEPTSPACLEKIRQTCEQSNAGKPPERADECINRLTEINNQDATGDNPTTPDDGNNPTNP